MLCVNLTKAMSRFMKAALRDEEYMWMSSLRLTVKAGSGCEFKCEG
jgi:hypothetical protein